jgi:dTDP-4-dehydrorhamnose 3,5-epimerase
MIFRELKIKDLLVIEPEPFKDERGKFYRIFCKNELKQVGISKEIVQINQSLTKHKGTIRGMHFQISPKAEMKIIKCINGVIYDVAIDLRKWSPTLLQWHGEVLSAENMKSMCIPEGFAHGFQALESNSELLYLHTEFYSPEHEGGIRYNDPLINIKWPLEITEVSTKDSEYEFLNNNFKGIEI